MRITLDAGTGNVYELTYKVELAGRIYYALRAAGQKFPIFEGRDFRPSPCHSNDGIEAVRGLLNFLCLRPGDTDEEYFANYTETQQEFSEGDAEDLQAFYCWDPQEDPDNSRRNYQDPWEGGTVSHGTMREEDLIPAFTDVLGVLDPLAAAYVHRICEPEEGSNDPEFVLEELFDQLDEWAPEGYYFGAHPGDGSDFGFWQNEEEA